MNFTGNGSYEKGNKNSFLFAFKDNKAIKCRCVDDVHEIATSNIFLFFGYGTLAIKPDSNINEDSFCN